MSEVGDPKGLRVTCLKNLAYREREESETGQKTDKVCLIRLIKHRSDKIRYQPRMSPLKNLIVRSRKYKVRNSLTKPRWCSRHASSQLGKGEQSGDGSNQDFTPLPKTEEYASKHDKEEYQRYEP